MEEFFILLIKGIRIHYRYLLILLLFLIMTTDFLYAQGDSLLVLKNHTSIGLSMNKGLTFTSPVTNYKYTTGSSNYMSIGLKIEHKYNQRISVFTQYHLSWIEDSYFKVIEPNFERREILFQHKDYGVSFGAKYHFTKPYTNQELFNIGIFYTYSVMTI